MPALLFLGEDDFSKAEALAALRERLGPPEMAVSSMATLEGAALVPEELLQTCSTVPFLAAERLVVVSGLMARFEPRGPRRGSGRRRSSEQGQLGAWERLRSYLEREMPPTTTLVLVEETLSAENPLLKHLQAVVETRRFPPLSLEQAQGWIQGRLKARGQAAALQAVRVLAHLLGSNLWALSQEIEKLSLFVRGERPIAVEDVRLLVAEGREPTVFAFIDAVVEGRAAPAMASLQRLLQGGATSGYLLGMLGRQVRLLLEARGLFDEGVSLEEMGRRLGVRQRFALQKLLEQAQRHPSDRLHRFHQALLDTDVAIKTGVLEEATALELLAGELVALAAGERASPVPRRSSPPPR